MKEYGLSDKERVEFIKEWKAVTLRLKLSGYDLNKIQLVGEGVNYDTGTDQGNSENND